MSNTYVQGINAKGYVVVNWVHWVEYLDLLGLAGYCMAGLVDSVALWLYPVGLALGWVGSCLDYLV